jgi:putative hemolysin
MQITRTAIIRRAVDLAIWNRRTAHCKPDILAGLRMARRELRNGDTARWFPTVADRLDALRGQLVRLDCMPWSSAVAAARSEVMAEISALNATEISIAA